MIYINNRDKLDKIKKSKSFFVITDFDRTLTTRESEPSMGIIPNYLGGECYKERTKIFQHYRPIELDYTLKKEIKEKHMREWALASFTILSKYVKEEVVSESLQEANLHLRFGAKEFLKSLNDKEIPVIIMSSGIGNVVEGFLKKENCLFDNTIIVSNFFKFIDGKSSIDLNNLIATTTKEYKIIPEEMKNKIKKISTTILFGDLIEDIKMADKDNIENTLTVGFLDDNVEVNLEKYNKNFDIVLTDNDNFNTIKDILNWEEL